MNERKYRYCTFLLVFTGCRNVLDKTIPVRSWPMLLSWSEILATCHKMLIESSEVVSGKFHFNFSIETD